MSSIYEACSPKDLEFLVVVKTYPQPSLKHEEIVCTGGITAEGKWLRLYPVPYRYLDGDKAFKKYQWVKCKVAKRTEDARPESYRPLTDTIELGRVVPTDRHWQERRSILVPYARQSMEDIVARWHESKESAGMFRPKEVLDVIVERDAEEWDAKYLEKTLQTDLFDQVRPLEKVAWRFKCVYRCDDPRCDKPHEQTIRDWEMFQLYRKLRDKCGEEEAAQQVKARILNFFTDKYETYLVVGSIGRFSTFIIGSLFTPTRDLGASLPLWEDSA